MNCKIIDIIKQEINDIFGIKKIWNLKKFISKYTIEFKCSDEFKEILFLETEKSYEIFNKFIIEIINNYIDNKITFEELESYIDCTFTCKNNEKKEYYNKIFPEFIKVLIKNKELLDEDKIIIHKPKNPTLYDSDIDDIISDNEGNNEIHNDGETEENELNDLELLDYDKKREPFDFRDNQKDAINNTINQGFKSGIHCQIMGAGKTFIMLNIIYQHWLAHKQNLKYMILTDKIEILKSWFMIKYFDKIDNDYKKSRKINILNKQIRESQDFIEHKINKFKTSNYYKIKDGNDYYTFNYDRFKKWSDDNIIDMNEFDITENIINKDVDILNVLNEPLNKPVIWICNNAFLKVNNKYKKINLDNMELIMVDECHSISGQQNYDMLEYFRNKGVNIQGFSATPLRPIKNASEHLLKVYGLTPDDTESNELNVISNYDMIKALKDGVILPFVHNIIIPETHKDSLKIKSTNKDELTLRKIFEEYVINNSDLPYKKCTIWTNSINKIAKDKGSYYNELKEICGNKIKLFVSYSGNNENKEINEIGDFENCDKNAFLLCVNRVKEGSDIKNLDCGIFLDAVKNRSIVSAMQSVGRIMRPDEAKKKKYAYIIECVKVDDNKTIESVTVSKVLNYYKKILNISSLSKSSGYLDEILRLFDETEIVNEEDNNVINIKVTKDITCKINLKVKEIDWRIFQEKLRTELTKRLKLNENEILEREFIKLKHQIKRIYKTKDEYLKSKNIKNPEVKYKNWWNGWYDFLGFDVRKYPKNKEAFIAKCKEYNLTDVETYNDFAEEVDLPLMPEELYKNFTTLYNELNKQTKRR